MTDLADRFHDALQAHQGEPAYRKLRIRLREMGKNVSNEQKQFRTLQRACAEDPAIGRSLADVGFEDVASLTMLPPDERTADLIQAFNEMVERYWEDW